MIEVLFVTISNFYRVWFTCLFLACLMEVKWIGVAISPSSWQTIVLVLDCILYLGSVMFCSFVQYVMLQSDDFFMGCCNVFPLHTCFIPQKHSSNLDDGQNSHALQALLQNFMKRCPGIISYTGKFDAYTLSFQYWSLWLFIQAINFYSRANNIKSGDPIILGNRSTAYIR